jgi:DNA polymerase elongation subunit (family B)
VLTAKLLNIFYPFVAAISSLTQIPSSEILTLPAGMIAEYFLLRFIELLGFAPEYRATMAKLEGERVWNIGEGQTFHNVVQVDVKMMYPSFVLHNYVDPSLHVGGNSFDRMAGIGVLFSAVRRLATIRELTKKLKKTNPLFEPIDKGIKAILNALAYGVQGKQSGLSIMGNPWCPSKIFYGTREAQFSAIEFLKKKGYRIVYSDTDSFFVSFDNKPGEEDVKKLLLDVNTFLSQYGLEADLEDIWDYMFIYSKKNYILRKGDKIVVKGSALRNLSKFYLPECINLHELLRIDDKEERKKYIRGSN